MPMKPEYNQQPGESLEDWKYRVIFSKIKNECSLTWNEIVGLLGLEYSGEYLRKIAYGVGRYAAYLDGREEEALLNDREQSKFSDLEAKELKFRKEKMRMQDQKRELNKLLREWARAEHIEDTIKKAVEKSVGTFDYTPSEFEGSSFEEKEGALLLSDWHYGMFTSNVANIFNEEIFHERINKLIDKTIEYGNQNNIKTLHIFALGDLINGLIHVTTRINNTENVIKQTMAAAEAICTILMTLSESFPEIKIYFARGNHERVSPNKKESLTEESFFDTIPWYIKARISGIDNISIVENQYNSEIVVTDILGSKIFAVHGHNDKATNVVQNLSSILKLFPDYIFMGHHHCAAENEVNGAEVITNSSLCGTDDYAISLRKTAKPAQKFIVFDESGRLCTYNIRLDGEK